MLRNSNVFDFNDALLTVAMAALTFRKVPAQRELSVGFSLHWVLLVHSRPIEIPVEGPGVVLTQRFHTETVCIQALGRTRKEVWAHNEQN